MLLFANSSPEFLKTEVTVEETRVYRYDPETKVQSPQMKTSTSPRPRESRKLRSKVVMLVAFFYYQGIVHNAFALESQTIKTVYYREDLLHLRDTVRRKGKEL